MATLFIILGGTGDLTNRKLVPALYSLYSNGQLSADFHLISIGRRGYDTNAYHALLEQSSKPHIKRGMESQKWQKFLNLVSYYEMDFTQPEAYKALKEYLYQHYKNDHEPFNILFYLAVAPDFFSVIAENIAQFDLQNEADGWRRIVIEKPFGRDLGTARQLNQTLTKVFNENRIYRIDHYLGKQMIQNLFVIRFANTLFEPLWNRHYIDHVQIWSSETLGVENRGNYYEQSGAMRDMVQSHLLQLLAMLTMEMPTSLKVADIRKEKIQIFQSFRTLTSEKIKKYVIRGQYGSGVINHQAVAAYRDEPKVEKESLTETFIAMKMMIDSQRWSGVPFYLRTGKRLNKSSTEIIVTFKPLAVSPYASQIEDSPNRLVIRIQPTEGVFLEFNAKKFDSIPSITKVQMDYCHVSESGINSSESYQRLLLDALHGDQTLFTSWEEIDYAWQYVDTILDYWKMNPSQPFLYPAGSTGPVESDQMLMQDGHSWIDL